MPRKILSTYRKSRPGASPADLYVAITTSRAMWLGSIEIAEKKCEQKAAPVYMYMFTHESNFIVPGTNHRLGAAHATEIWYKFDNVDLGPGSHASVTHRHGSGSKEGRPEHERDVGHFARTGRPGAKGQPSWPAYTPQTARHHDDRYPCRFKRIPSGRNSRCGTA